jgi:hypothetical protein
MAMTDLCRKLIAFLFAISLPAALFAQAELLDEEQAPIKRYTVELIVFAYAEDVAVGTEVFPADIIEPIAAQDDSIAEIVVTELRRRHPDFIDLDPVFLTATEFAMEDVYERFDLLDAYDPIMHVGWTQVGSPQTDTDPIPLTAFGAPPEGLNGSFTLYLGRYLHLVVDLAMDAPVTEYELFIDDELAYVFTDSRQQTDDQPQLLEGPVRYRLQEDRIVKNGETRYFDHPKFGVVAKVFRVEDLDDDEATVQPPLVGVTSQ